MEYTSVQNHVASIAPLHYFNDLSPPDLAHYSIQQSLNGLRRTKIERPNRRNPITPHMLFLIHKNLDYVAKKFRASYWATCIFAFTTLLRKSNLLPSKHNKHFLRLSDVKMTDSGLLLSVRELKTQRFLQSILEIPISAMPTSALCPVAAFRAL